MSVFAPPLERRARPVTVALPPVIPLLFFWGPRRAWERAGEWGDVGLHAHRRRRGHRGFFPFPGLFLVLGLVWWVGAMRHGWGAGWLFGPLAWLGFIVAGKRVWTLERAWRRRERAVPVPQQAQPQEDPRIVRVDALAEALKAELTGLSDALKPAGHDPARTAEALRQACHGLVKREAELRARVDPADDARLAREREALETRIQRESDAVVRERLTAALAALDAQRHERDEVRRAAERLGAEHTRLLYTLEHLRTQVLRLRSADAAQAGVAGAGLERQLHQLAEELEAVAASLESVGRDERPER